MSWDTISSPLLSRKAKWRCAKSRSLPLLEATSKLRKLHADTLLVETCVTEAPAALLGRARLLRNVFAALVATFLGATDGLSLGGLLFPSSKDFPNHEYQALGMSIGLLTTLVANLGSLLGSEVSFGVAGASLPTVILLAEYFKTLGPSKCSTIYALASICTLLIGLSLYLVGHLRLARLVKACPFVIYGGFMAGTGAVLLQYGLRLLLPQFTSLVELSSYQRLLDVKHMERWLPGTLCGATMFGLRAKGQRLPGVPEDLLIPASLLAEACLFFAWMCFSNCGLEEARARGLLFPVKVPERLEFYELWARHASLDVSELLKTLAAPSFWLTAANAAVISALTAVMNVFGTASAAQIQVDMDREMRLHGAYNVCSGLLSGLNANMVMSFSITCRTLGADGRQFQVLLSLFSLLIFLCGDFVVALLPRCLPGSVLVWLSLELMAFWVYNALSFLRPYEYGLVWLMIFMYVVLGTAPMMLFGLCGVSLIVSAQLAALPVLRTRRSLAQLRSPRLHTTCDREYLNRAGKQAEVWFLGTAYLYFASMRQIVEALEEFPRQRHVAYQSRTPLDEELPDFAFSQAVSCEVREAPSFVVLDFDLVHHMESTAVAAFQEVLSVAQGLGCSLLLANLRPELLQQMERFRLPLLRLEEVREMTLSGRLLVGCSLEQALEAVEEALLQRYVPPLGRCREESHVGLRQRLARANLDPLGSLYGLWLDFHVWLEPYCGGYRPELLAKLQDFVELRELREEEVVYEAQATGGWMAEVERRVPLVWLLQGGVDHVWNPLCDSEQSVRAFQEQHRLRCGVAFEQARVLERRGAWCAGPFSTVRAFLCKTAHPGSLVATRPSTVALLRGYEELPQELQQLLQSYLLRKWPIYVRT